MSKEDIIQRFNVLNDMCTSKFKDRPTYDTYDKNKKEMFHKIGDLNDKLRLQNENLDRLVNQFEDNSLQFEDINNKLRLKLENEALTPLWKHFERFSLYDDLKVLYNKVMPEIQKLDQRQNENSEGIEQNK